MLFTLKQLAKTEKSLLFSFFAPKGGEAAPNNDVAAKLSNSTKIIEEFLLSLDTNRDKYLTAKELTTKELANTEARKIVKRLHETFGGSPDTFETQGTGITYLMGKMMERQTVENAFVLENFANDILRLKKETKQETEALRTDAAETVNISVAIDRLPNSGTTLKEGSEGEIVKILNEALFSLGYSVTTDMIYSSRTKKAVEDFQRNSLKYDEKKGQWTRVKLGVDGIAGPDTFKAVKAKYKEVHPSAHAPYNAARNAQGIASGKFVNSKENVKATKEQNEKAEVLKNDFIHSTITNNALEAFLNGGYVNGYVKNGGVSLGSMFRNNKFGNYFLEEMDKFGLAPESKRERQKIKDSAENNGPLLLEAIGIRNHERDTIVNNVIEGVKFFGIFGVPVLKLNVSSSQDMHQSVDITNGSDFFKAVLDNKEYKAAPAQRIGKQLNELASAPKELKEDVTRTYYKAVDLNGRVRVLGASFGVFEKWLFDKKYDQAKVVLKQYEDLVKTDKFDINKAKNLLAEFTRIIEAQYKEEVEEKLVKYGRMRYEDYNDGTRDMIGQAVYGLGERDTRPDMPKDYFPVYDAFKDKLLKAGIPVGEINTIDSSRSPHYSKFNQLKEAYPKEWKAFVESKYATNDKLLKESFRAPRQHNRELDKNIQYFEKFRGAIVGVNKESKAIFEGINEKTDPIAKKTAAVFAVFMVREKGMSNLLGSRPVFSPALKRVLENIPQKYTKEDIIKLSNNKEVYAELKKYMDAIEDPTVYSKYYSEELVKNAPKPTQKPEKMVNEKLEKVTGNRYGAPFEWFHGNFKSWAEFLYNSGALVKVSRDLSKKWQIVVTPEQLRDELAKQTELQTRLGDEIVGNYNDKGRLVSAGKASKLTTLDFARMTFKKEVVIIDKSGKETVYVEENIVELKSDCANLQASKSVRPYSEKFDGEFIESQRRNTSGSAMLFIPGVSALGIALAVSGGGGGGGKNFPNPVKGGDTTAGGGNTSNGSNLGGLPI